MDGPSVWIFNGSQARLPSGVFQTKEAAEEWIRANRLSGTLTQYPLDMGVHAWAVQQGFFQPRKPEHSSPQFIQSFSSAHQAHEHYDAGE